MVGEGCTWCLAVAIIDPYRGDTQVPRAST